MKFCLNCSTEKPLDSFAKHKGMKDGLQVYCKECYKEKRKAYKHKSKEYASKYREANRDTCKIRIKEWKQNNKGAVNAQTAKRHAAKMQRTALWADLDKIKAYYDVCSFFNEVNGYIKYHVDHIVPMQGANVSGLHVHNNLQVILATENVSKSNNYAVSGY